MNEHYNHLETIICDIQMETKKIIKFTLCGEVKAFKTSTELLSETLAVIRVKHRIPQNYKFLLDNGVSEL